MNHAIHICALVCVLLQPGLSEDKPIPGKDFFPLSANIEGVISPVLLKELQEKRPNVTSAIQQIASTTEKPKSQKTPRKFRTTTPPPPTEKLPELLGFDLARAQQVRQDNQYPFDYQNSFNNFNNFNSFPGIGSPGLTRQFGNGFNNFDDIRSPFNSARQLSSLIDGSKTSENTIQGNDRQSGQSGQGGGNSEGNRNPYGNQGGLFDYDRYRGGFGGFGYDDRFNGRLNDQSFRNVDDGFGYSNFPQQNNNNQFNNFRQDFRGNFPLNSQQGSGLRGDQAYNYQGYSGNQGYSGGYSGNFPFQGYAPNNAYDIYQQQRGFQGGDEYGRGGDQRGLSYPGYYPVRPDAPGRGTGNPGGVNGNQGGVNSGNGNSDAEDVGTITAATKKTETVKKLDEKKNAEAKSSLNEGLPVDPRGIKQLFYPQLEDYSDVRFRPDGFKQFIVYPSFNGNRHNNDDILG